MTALRVVAILIGFMVITHSGVMAWDPHAERANGYDPAHDTVFTLVCDESDVISSASRLPHDPLMLPAPAVESGVPVPAPGDTARRGWVAPTIHPETLRTFLQVFLN